MRRSWQLDALILAALFMLATGPARADGDPPLPPTTEDAPLEVYNVNLAIDLPVIAVGGGAGLLRTYLANHYVTQRCPCRVDEINLFDRPWSNHRRRRPDQ
jgi:hypothetical protein